MYIEWYDTKLLLPFFAGHHAACAVEYIVDMRVSHGSQKSFWVNKSDRDVFSTNLAHKPLVLLGRPLDVTDDGHAVLGHRIPSLWGIPILYVSKSVDLEEEIDRTCLPEVVFELFVFFGPIPDVDHDSYNNE